MRLLAYFDVSLPATQLCLEACIYCAAVQVCCRSRAAVTALGWRSFLLRRCVLYWTHIGLGLTPKLALIPSAGDG